MRPSRLRWVRAAGAMLLMLGGIALAQQAGRTPPPHEHLDSRFSHDQYYFDRGYTVRKPPPGGPGELRDHDGQRYLYRGGNWYRRDGRSWIVWGAPLGIHVPILPPFFTTIWWYGVPFYYANDTYYVWDDERRGYEVVAPPDGIDGTATTRPPASDRLFVYPKNGQSGEQQKRDDYECHRWAAGQSGFDPTLPGGGVPAQEAVAKRNDYFRAQIACLEGRGYTVQ